MIFDFSPVASADVVYFRAFTAVSPGWPSRTSVHGGVCGLQRRTEGGPNDRHQHSLDRTAAKAWSSHAVEGDFLRAVTEAAPQTLMERDI
jgi:hypothetical protein